MAYYVEYAIPPADGDKEFEMPVSETPGHTVRLSETDAPIVEAEELSARSGVFGATLEEAKRAAEEIIEHSRATRAVLYEDPSESTDMGVGTPVAQYSQQTGWQ